MRRLVFAVAALVAFAQAALLGAVLFVLSAVIGAYSMSMAGTDPAQAQVALRVLAVLLVALLVALGVLLVVAAVRDRGLSRSAKALLVAGLVVQGIVMVIAAVALGPYAFAITLLVFGCLLGALFVEPSAEPA
jgi:hypothetical protein